MFGSPVCHNPGLRTLRSGDRFSFKNLYLKHLLRALRSVNSRTAEGSSLAERRRAIKLAADMSLALTARRAAWSHHALINNLISGKNKSLLQKIAGRKKLHSILVLAERARNHSFLSEGSVPANRSSMQKRRFRRARRMEYPLPSCAFARKLVDDRTKQLRSLIPGGESIRSSCLMRETADYIASLKTQVEVMQSLANSLQFKHPV